MLKCSTSGKRDSAADNMTEGANAPDCGPNGLLHANDAPTFGESLTDLDCDMPPDGFNPYTLQCNRAAQDGATDVVNVAHVSIGARPVHDALGCEPEIAEIVKFVGSVLASTRRTQYETGGLNNNPCMSAPTSFEATHGRFIGILAEPSGSYWAD